MTELTYFDSSETIEDITEYLEKLLVHFSKNKALAYEHKEPNEKVFRIRIKVESSALTID